MFHRVSPRRWSAKRTAAAIAAVAMAATALVGVSSLQTANAAESPLLAKNSKQCLTRSTATKPDRNTGNDFYERFCYLPAARDKVYGGSAPQDANEADLVGKLNAGETSVLCQQAFVGKTANPWFGLVEVSTPVSTDKYNRMGWVNVSLFSQAASRPQNQALLGVPDCKKKAEWTTIDLADVNSALNAANGKNAQNTVNFVKPATTGTNTGTGTSTGTSNQDDVKPTVSPNAATPSAANLKCTPSTFNFEGQNTNANKGTASCTVWKAGGVQRFADSKDIAGTGMGTISTGKHNFLCQRQFSNRPSSSTNPVRNNLAGKLENTNTWWLATRGDSGFGWFPATHILEGTNDQKVPGVKVCSESYWPEVPTVV